MFFKEERMKFSMVKIEGGKRGWNVLIDGKEWLGGIIEISSKFGVFTYGKRPEGYDSWVFRESRGGGAVTIPYVFSPPHGQGELLIGLIKENRANMGDEPVWCVMGGFVNPGGETHQEAQTRESTEESGIDVVNAKELKGVCTNPNRAFFVADVKAGEGVHAYGLELPFNWLEEEKLDIWKLKEVKQLLDFKKTSDVRFFPWRESVEMTGDALARSAIAQLLAKLL